MTGRPIPPPPQSTSILWQVTAADAAARELLAEELADLLKSGRIGTASRSTVVKLLADILLTWAAWSTLAGRLEAELAESTWPSEVAA